MRREAIGRSPHRGHMLAGAPMLWHVRDSHHCQRLGLVPHSDNVRLVLGQSPGQFQRRGTIVLRYPARSFVTQRIVVVSAGRIIVMIVRHLGNAVVLHRKLHPFLICCARVLGTIRRRIMPSSPSPSRVSLAVRHRMQRCDVRPRPSSVWSRTRTCSWFVRKCRWTIPALTLSRQRGAPGRRRLDPLLLLLTWKSRPRDEGYTKLGLHTLLWQDYSRPSLQP